MKLDRLKFAELIGYCANRGMTVDKSDVIVIDNIIEMKIPGRANTADINELMRAIHNGEKIAATKAYRSLTGYGLKEANDAVEKDWNRVETKQEYRTRMNDKIDAQIDRVYNVHKYTLAEFTNEQLMTIKDFINSF